jgi:hypothetical protein
MLSLLLQSMESEFMRRMQTLMDDLDGTSTDGNVGTGSSSSSNGSSRPFGSLFGRSFASLEELEAVIEEQLREAAPPDLLTWLQEFEQQARQQQQQQQQGQEQQECAPRSSSEGSGLGGSNGRGSLPPASQQATQQQQQPLQPWQQPAARTAVQQLQQLGAQVYLPIAAALATPQQEDGAATAVDDGSGGESGWGSLAGYESQKQALEDYLLLPLKHPEVGEGGGKGVWRAWQ